MGRYKKQVHNKDFFKRETKKKYYVLGSAASSCILPEKNITVFRSKHKRLIEIVNENLDSEYDIYSDHRDRNSYWIQINNQKIYQYLRKLRFKTPKKQRIFPIKDIPEKYLDHYIRGFWDARNNTINNKNYNIIFNYFYLYGLHKALVEHTGIKHKKPTRNKMHFSYEDSKKIHDFIYQDWDYIKKHGLFLPNKKKGLDLNIQIPEPGRTNKVKAIKRIEKAKILLLQGKRPWDIYKQVGYSHSSGLSMGFKLVTGMTMSEFVKNQTGMSLRQWAKENSKN